MARDFKPCEIIFSKIKVNSKLSSKSVGQGRNNIIKNLLLK